MKVSLNKEQFIDMFKECNRGDNFSYEARAALFDYFEEYEENTGEEINVDIIAFCCEFTEYKNLKEVQENYDSIKDLDDLRDHTTVIEFKGGLVISNF